MKSIAWFLIAFLCSTATYAQTIRFASLKTTGFFIEKSFRTITSPQIGWKKRRHSLAIGPSILLAEERTVSEKQFPKLSGIQFNYSLFPVKSDCALNFKLSYEFNTLILENEWEAEVWSIVDESYQTHRYVNNEFIFNNVFGYGIILRVGRNFKIEQGIGLGLYHSITDNNERSAKAPEIGDQNINGYPALGFIWGLNMGFYYEFN